MPAGNDGKKVCPECDSDCYYNGIRNIWVCDGCGKEWDKEEL